MLLKLSYHSREFSKEREKAASRGEYQKNKARSQMDIDMKVKTVAYLIMFNYKNKKCSLYYEIHRFHK